MPPIGKSCKFCKRYFKVPFYRRYTASYCSVTCRASSKFWLKKMKQIAISLRGKDKIKKVCLYCYRRYFIFPSLKKISKFCSRVCHAKYYIAAWNKGKTKKDFPQMSNSGVKKGTTAWNKGKGTGLRSYPTYTAGFSHSLKEIVRDKFGRKCQVCGCPEIECIERLSIHHIDYNPKNLKLNNLIPLCRNCHSKTLGGKELRLKWKDYFKELIENAAYK